MVGMVIALIVGAVITAVVDVYLAWQSIHFDSAGAITVNVGAVVGGGLEIGAEIEVQTVGFIMKGKGVQTQAGQKNGGKDENTQRE